MSLKSTSTESISIEPASAQIKTTSSSLRIGFLIFPNITPLDALGPAQFLARVPGAEILTVWKEIIPITSDAGFNIIPTTTIADCPDLDVLCIPGGFGTEALLSDSIVLDFIKAQATQAKYLTAVCTGSLVLGAAGLLVGKKATTHWAWHHRLEEFSAIPVKERVVSDGNIVTGGGVTAGIDFGLTLIAKLIDEQTAKQIQLGMEYDPKPPFDSGSPDKADPTLVASIKKVLEERTKSS